MRFHRLLARIAAMSVALGIGLASGAIAQNPTGRAGGGGRGRARPPQIMTLTAADWKDGAAIPPRHAQIGHDVSPALAWSAVPATTTSFVLIVHDIDAPSANGVDDALQWMVWNIPATSTSLPEGVAEGGERPDGSRQISVTGPYYRGPAAPATGAVHHYVFELFALDTIVSVPAVGASPAATRAAVTAAMAGHIRGKASLFGLYRRAEP
jgi:Raf kinase inhibitor-like YbhB/YbcL family protein